jgi:DNA repair exonuclease SbcCD nuclease subunit
MFGGIKMKELTFIHCGDIHLDARFTATGLSDIKAKERRQEIRDTFSRIIDEVIKHKVHVLFISGDLFEHEYISRNTAEFIINQFKRIPGVKIFISPGNHDPYVANSYYVTLDWPSNVHIFTNMMKSIELPEYNAAIYGIGFTGKYQYQSMLTGLRNMDYSKINILVTHGTLDNISSECPYHPVKSTDIKRWGFDYVALGHIHKMGQGKDYPDVKAVYCGSPEPLGFDEPGDHGIILGRITKQGIATQFIKMNKRQYITKEMDISNMATIDELESNMKEQLYSLTDDFVKIVLTGRKNREMDLDIQLITSRLVHHCFYLKIVDDTCPDYQLEELCKQYNLKGIFTRKMLEEIDKTQDEQMKKKLYKALYLGLDALN